jgi:ATP-dependent Clp protease, protease subunit
MAKTKFWNFKNKDDSTGELTLYSDISNSTWWGDEVTPAQFKKDLDALGDIKNLNIYINSGGGDVFAGQAIYSMLKRHQANKTVYVDGLAASIASLIAMAGDKIVMPSNAMMMIHNAWTIAAGNKEDFRKIADDMEKIDESIVGVYAIKTGLANDEIKGLMEAETWFTAEQAVEKGFADEIEKEKKLAASIKDGFLMLNTLEFDLSRYKNAPNVDEVKSTNVNGEETQPVPDTQVKYFRSIRKKLIHD